MYSAALPFIILGIGGDAGDLSLTLTLFAVTQAALLPFAGVVADAFPRRSMLIGADLVRVLAMAVVAMLLLTGQLSIIVVALATALLGAARAFFRPAIRGLMPDLVPGERLVSANALRSLADEVLGIIGPAVGGLLVAAGAVLLVVWFNAASFAAAALFVVAISSTADVVTRPGSHDGAASFFVRLRHGLRAVRARPWLWRMIALGSLGNIAFAGGLSVAMPLFADAELGGAAAYGFILAAMAVGSVMSLLGVGVAGRLPRRGILYYLAVLIAGSAMALLAIATDAWTASILAAVIGASVSFFVLIMETLIQQLVPADTIGRVAALQSFGSLALLPVGYAVVTLLIDATSPATAMVVLGMSLIGIAVLALASRTIRDVG